jgi:agmatinase
VIPTDPEEWPAFLGIEPPAYDRAAAVIVPVPFEGTVSYGAGASRGPEAILRASTQVELHDERLGYEPRVHGIWTDRPLAVGGAAAEEVCDRLAGRVGEHLDAGKWVVTLGGEHSITPGAVRAVAERHPDLAVVQLDAHADLREQYEGDRFSHACAIARSLEHASRVVAVGVRSWSPEEQSRLRTGIPGYRMVPAWEIGAAGWIDRALDGLDGATVYLTVDLDYFDPSVVAATGTPEPGGGTWWPTLELLDALFSRCRVVAADVVELAPVKGLHPSDFTAARLVHKLVGFRFRGRSRVLDS